MTDILADDYEQPEGAAPERADLLAGAAPPPRDALDSEIVIVGAGAAGLSAAYYLKLQGYRNVTVLEKQGRVGGLCQTVTEDYACFDLGANYLTPAYRETLRLARAHDCGLYREKNILIGDFSGEEGVEIRTPWQAAKGDTPTWKFVVACLRYARLRWKLRKLVDAPGHARLVELPELTTSFHAWLDSNNLLALQRMFEVPISVMGYGQLADIPAPYALKYMSLPTFRALCLRALPWTAWFYPWPKRFRLGFQWLWERMARELNVLTNVTVDRIERSTGGQLLLRYTHQEQHLNDSVSEQDEFYFDWLILACPLHPDVLGEFLDLSEQERALFSSTRTNSYCMTSLKASMPESLPEEFALATIPLRQKGEPWAIAKQVANSGFLQFYTWIEDTEDDPDTVRSAVVATSKQALGRLGGEVREDDPWHSFDRWPYFKHVDVATYQSGFYDHLEALQGRQRTYYLGGLLDFELIERIVRYSKHLVEARFPPDRPAAPPSDPPPAAFQVVPDPGQPTVAAPASSPPRASSAPLRLEPALRRRLPAYLAVGLLLAAVFASAQAVLHSTRYVADDLFPVYRDYSWLWLGISTPVAMLLTPHVFGRLEGFLKSLAREQRPFGGTSIRIVWSGLPLRLRARVRDDDGRVVGEYTSYQPAFVALVSVVISYTVVQVMFTLIVDLDRADARHWLNLDRSTFLTV